MYFYIFMIHCNARFGSHCCSVEQRNERTHISALMKLIKWKAKSFRNKSTDFENLLRFEHDWVFLQLGTTCVYW